LRGKNVEEDAPPTQSAVAQPVLKQACGFCMCCDVHGNRMANRNAEIFSLESQLKNLRAELNESQRLLDKAKELYQELRKTSKKQQQQLKRAEDANNVNEVPKQPEPGISEVSKATAWRKRKRAEEKLEDAAELIAGEAKDKRVPLPRPAATPWPRPPEILSPPPTNLGA